MSVPVVTLSQSALLPQVPVTSRRNETRPLHECLATKDAQQKIRLNDWVQAFTALQIQSDDDLAKARQEGYVLDIKRTTLIVQKEVLPEHSTLETIDQKMFLLLKEHCSKFKANDRMLQYLRYQLQDLMSQGIYKLILSFSEKYLHEYAAKNMILTGNDGVFGSEVALNFERNLVQIVATCKSKVVYMPTMDIFGYDAQRVVITVDLEKVTLEHVLLADKACMVSVSFHGFTNDLSQLAKW